MTVQLVREEKGVRIRHDEVLVQFAGSRDAIEKWRSRIQREFGKNGGKVNKIRNEKRYTWTCPMTPDERFKMEVDLWNEIGMRNKPWRKLLSFNIV